jgi:hypothetical protein
MNCSLEQHPAKESTTYLELKLIQMAPIACNIFTVLCATEREIFRDLQPCARLQTRARDSMVDMICESLAATFGLERTGCTLTCRSESAPSRISEDLRKREQLRSLPDWGSC